MQRWRCCGVNTSGIDVLWTKNWTFLISCKSAFIGVFEVLRYIFQRFLDKSLDILF